MHLSIVTKKGHFSCLFIVVLCLTLRKNIKIIELVTEKQEPEWQSSGFHGGVVENTIFWDMMPGHWVIGSWRFEKIHSLNVQWSRGMRKIPLFHLGPLELETQRLYFPWKGQEPIT